MVDLRLLYEFRALFADGSLRIASRTKVPRGTRIRWGKGNVTIGERVFIRHGVIIDAQEGSIDIGRHVSLNDYTILLGRGGIRIGDDVRIAAHAMIISFEHNFDDIGSPIRTQGVTKRPVVIEDDVWIGAGAKILAGAHIARGCVIGANAVIKGRTIPYGVYVGAPARLVRMRGASKIGNEPLDEAVDLPEASRSWLPSSTALCLAPSKR